MCSIPWGKQKMPGWERIRYGYTAEKRTQGRKKVRLCGLLIGNLGLLLSVFSRGEHFVHHIRYEEMNSRQKIDDLDLHASSGQWIL